MNLLSLLRLSKIVTTQPGTMRKYPPFGAVTNIYVLVQASYVKRIAGEDESNLKEVLVLWVLVAYLSKTG